MYIILSIHFVDLHLSLSQGDECTGAFSSYLGGMTGCHPNKLPVYRLAKYRQIIYALTESLDLPISLMCIFLDCWRTPEYQERSHRDAGLTSSYPSKFNHLWVATEPANFSALVDHAKHLSHSTCINSWKSMGNQLVWTGELSLTLDVWSSATQPLVNVIFNLLLTGSHCGKLLAKCNSTHTL